MDRRRRPVPRLGWYVTAGLVTALIGLADTVIQTVAR
jgi:hypothetical protein